MGLPAVNIQYARYSIPTALITYDEILRAGVLPTVALALVAAYLYWVHKESRAPKRTSRASLLLQVVMWPIVLPLTLALFTAVLCFYVLALWGALWLFARPFGYFDISFTNRDLLKGAAVLLVPMIGLFVWAVVRSNDEAKPEPTAAAGTQGGARTDPVRGYLRKFLESPREVPIHVLAMGVVSLPLALVLYALIVKVVLYLWEPGWSDLFTYWYAIGGAVIVGLLYLTMAVLFIALGWMKDADGSKRILGFVAVAVILSTAYVSLAAYYSYRIYPWLPRGFGGGRADGVVVWVSSDSALGLPKSSACVPAGANAVRCQGLSLLLADSDKVLLVTRPGGSMEGVLLSRDDVHVIAWSQSPEP